MPLDSILDMSWLIIGGLIAASTLLSFAGMAALVGTLALITAVVTAGLAILSGLKNNWEYGRAELTLIGTVAVISGILAFGGGLVGFSLETLAGSVGPLKPLISAFVPVAIGLTAGLGVNFVGGAVKLTVE